MGVDAADFDGDGLQEIFVTNFARDHATLYKKTTATCWFPTHQHIDALPQNLDVRDAQMGLRALYDYDNDGDFDIVIANGHIYPQVDQASELNESYRQLPTLLRNDGGKLTDVSRTAGTGACK